MSAEPFGFHQNFQPPEADDEFGDDAEDIVWGDPPPVRTRRGAPTLIEQAGLDIGENERVIFAGFDLDITQLMYDEIDTSRTPKGNKAGPSFNIGEVAKFFFGKTSYWVRWRERLGAFTIDGEPVANRRKRSSVATGKSSGARTYFLSDVELMAHALAEKGMITVPELYNAKLVLWAEGIIHGYLEWTSLR